MRKRIRWTHTRGLLAVFALVAVASVGGYFALSSRAQASSEAPFQFNHEVMVQQGIPCLYCHADAFRSPAAGIPSMEKCMGCHRTIATDNPNVKILADYYNRGQPIEWERLTVIPRFVYFSHRVHIAQGFNCERCHGDVGHTTVTRAVENMDMGWCLGCHEQQPNAKQLQDCIVCHI